jgi:hypothetical protein
MGIGSDAQWDEQDAQPPTLSRNAQLQVTVHINGTEVTRIVTSVRGASVTIEGVQGLSIEAVPSQSGPDQALVELKF